MPTSIPRSITVLTVFTVLALVLALAPRAGAEDAPEKKTTKKTSKDVGNDAGKKKEKPKPPADGDARTQWIEKVVELARGEDEAQRREALAMLLKHDQSGDCLQPVVKLLSDDRLSHDALVDVVRAVGRPGLDDAAAALLPLVAHASAHVRGNAAVSLEYIGSAGTADALKKQLGKEKIAAVKGHICRALGRCGAGEGSVRSLLLKHLGKASNDFDRVGPAVGLAYFEGDKAIARKLEKQLAKAIVKKNMTSGFTGQRKHGRLLGWVLSEIGDKKSAAFLRKKVLSRLENQSALGSEKAFFEAVARKLEGDPTAQKAIDQAVYSFSGLAGLGTTTSVSRSGSLSLFEMDEMRKERDQSPFRPKGDPKVAKRPTLASLRGG